MSPTALGIFAAARHQGPPETDGTAYGLAAATHGATSYYPMDDTGSTLVDRINARNGTLHTVGITKAAPNPLYAGSLVACRSAGSSSISNIATSSWQNASQFSLGFWFRPTSTADIVGVMSQWATGGNYNWMIWQRRGRLNLYSSVPSNVIDVDNGPVIKVGVDYHLVTTVSGTTQKFYVNGELLATLTLATAYVTLPDLVVAAYSTNPAGGVYSGLAIFNGVVLTDAQVLEQWTAGKIDRDRTAQAFWKLDDTSGTTMTDSSGKGRNASYATGVTLNQAPLHGTNSTAAVKSNASNYGLGILGYSEWLNSGEFTFSFWCKTPATVENIKAVAARWAGSTGWIIWWRNNTLGFLINGGGGGREFNGPAAVANTTKKYVVRVSGNVLSFFVNGVKVGSDITMPDNMPWVGHQLQLGSYNNLSNQTVATYDSIRYYTVALTDAEILAEYNADL